MHLAVPVLFSRRRKILRTQNLHQISQVHFCPHHGVKLLPRRSLLIFIAKCYTTQLMKGRLYVQQNLLDHGATLVQWRPSEITIMELWVLLLTLKKHSISGLCEFKYGKDEKGENQAKTQSHL